MDRFSIGGARGFSAGSGYRWFASFSDGTGPKVPAVGVVDALQGFNRLNPNGARVTRDL